MRCAAAPRRWHPEVVGLLIRLFELLLVLVPVVGAIIALTRGISAARGRGDDVPAPHHDAIPADQPRTTSVGSQAAQWRTITRVLDEHHRTDDRWLSYELDAAKLLDFPLITDMREDLTTRFHGAKFRADLLRPSKAEDLLDDRDAAREYLDAVEQYVTAFNAAEAEAIRRRRNDFTLTEQQRLARAQSLLRVAADASATTQERAQAYALAGKELDGLIVLPDRTRAVIERGVAGEIDG
jgi:hypothetical protein